MVAVQDQATNNGKPGRWTKSGQVVEVLPYDSYMVKIHGSRAATQRNRRFLRKISPFSPIIPVTVEETAAPVLTRAKTPTSVTEKQQANPSSKGTEHISRNLPIGPTAATHRLVPRAAPGEDVISLLKEQERQGLHLALENLYN